MTVQAVLFGPLLGAAFLLLNYLSIAAVTGDRRVALVASLILSLGGNSTFLDRPDPASGLPLNSVLHVPFHVISLGTAQSLGWVLLLPCLSLAFLAYRGFSRTRAIGAGLLLGALFHSHTLTFLNVAAAQLAYLVLANALERPRDARFKAWLVALSRDRGGVRRSSWPPGPRSPSRFPVALGVLGLRRHLPRRSEQALLPLELRHGRPPGPALRRAARAARRAAGRDAGRLERGADDDGRAAGRGALLRRVPAGRGRRVPLHARPAGARLGLGPPRLDRVPRGQPPLALGQPPVPLRDPPALPARHPRGARPARRTPAPGRDPRRLAGRRVPLRRGELRARPPGDGAVPGGRPGAGGVPRDGPRGDLARGGHGRPAARPRRADLPARPRAGDDAHELLAHPDVRAGLPARAVARAVLQPDGALLLPLPGLPQRRLPLRAARVRRDARPGAGARDDPRPAPADRDPAGVPDRLCRGPREALLGPPRAGRPALRLARRHPGGQRPLPAHGPAEPARPRATRPARLGPRDASRSA